MVRGLGGRYRAALAFLDRLVDWERASGLAFNAETIRLDLFRESLVGLGDPQSRYRTVLVAGTKGKGSTSYLLARLLRAHGLEVGLFISPHLIDVRERIQVNGRPISRPLFASLIERLGRELPYFHELGRSRTYFETITAAAFLHFAEREVDVAVLEVGLGGRLDATNVADPEVSVITPVSRDHMHVLGKTRLAIAGEKAGVLRPGRPVVLGPQPRGVREFLIARAGALGARAFVHGTDFRAVVRSVEEEGTTFDYAAEGVRWESLRLGLLGAHQASNASTALAALSLLLPSPEEKLVRRALRGAYWPGRGELLRMRPAVLLDGAHNGHSARVLGRLLADLWPGKKCVLLFGGSRGKEFRAIFRALLPFASEVILTESTHPRRCSARELQSVLRKVDPLVPCRVVPDLEEALRSALARQGTRPLLITGSLYLAGGARSAYRRLLAERRAAVIA